MQITWFLISFLKNLLKRFIYLLYPYRLSIQEIYITDTLQVEKNKLTTLQEYQVLCEAGTIPNLLNLKLIKKNVMLMRLSYNYFIFNLFLTFKGGEMSDLFDRITANQDVVKKLLGKIPGFSGYIERQNRRASDKILREAVADRFEEIWQRISNVQTELISTGGIEFVDDVERAAIKIRQFIDRIRHAAYGYSPFFDAAKVNEEELAQVYEFDMALLQSADEVGRAVDNIEQSLGTDGLPAAIRHLVSLAKQAVDAFNHRSELMMGGVESTDAEQPVE